MVYNYIRIQRGDLIKFNGHFYTKEEMEAFPPQYHEAPEQNTPEEVYIIFRQALLDDNIELALEQISEESKEEYREALNKPEKLKIYQEIPEVKVIKRQEKDSYGNYASYVYYDKEKIEGEIPYSIDFEKNWYGYWKIDSI